MAKIELAKRHRPSGVARSAHAPGLAFADYVARTRALIREATAGLARPPPEPVIDLRLPFELPADPAACRRDAAGRIARGVLLIHGLSDSPFLMRDMARRFEREGALVRAILLPGHGTVPGDLLEVSYREWVAAVRYGVESFAGVVGRLYLVGFSTGAALALEHLLNPPAPAAGAGAPSIGGLVLLAPGIRPRNRLTALAHWHQAFSWLLPRARWHDLHPDEDAFKYESFPRNAAAQFHRLTRALGHPERGPPFPVPLFMAVSADDATIDPRAARRFFRKRAPAGSRMLWYTDRPRPAVDHPGIEERQGAFPDAGVLGLSHLALPVHPGENPHYGPGPGGYRNLLHYRGGPPAPEALPLRYGELSHRDDARHRLQRLTFNPDFDGMMAAILGFIDALERG